MIGENIGIVRRMHDGYVLLCILTRWVLRALIVSCHAFYFIFYFVVVGDLYIWLWYRYICIYIYILKERRKILWSKFWYLSLCIYANIYIEMISLSFFSFFCVVFWTSLSRWKELWCFLRFSEYFLFGFNDIPVSYFFFLSCRKSKQEIGMSGEVLDGPKKKKKKERELK